MKSFLRDLSLVNKDYWLMLAMLFIMKIGQFMLLPFLAIYLSNISYVNLATIGIVVGIGPFVYGISGLFAGVIVDRFGIKNAIASSLFTSGIIFLLFFYNHSTVWFLLMSSLTGVTRSFFDIGAKSYGVSQLSLAKRRLYFSLRFMVVNSAAAIGPILGAYFTTTNSNVSFKIIGVVYLILFVLSIFIINNAVNSSNTDKPVAPASIRELVKILNNDKSLLLLMLISFIIWIIYSQLDSTLAQYLNSALNNGVEIYALLLIINAIGCASLQMLISELTKCIDEVTLSAIAMTLFAIGYILIALFLNLPILILSSLFIVVAEVIAMPLNDLLITKIAPSHRIGSYYGAISLSMLGLGLGPMLGGAIYQFLGAPTVFLLCGFLSVATIFLYKKLLLSIFTRNLSFDDGIKSA